MFNAVPPRFSVIVPTYNRAALLREALDALLCQTLPASAYEIIVVDDCSSDQTPGVVAGFVRRAMQARGLVVKDLRMAVNSGPATTRNKGLEVARGRLLAFIDDDCLPARNWLESLAKAWDHAENHDARPLGGLGGRTLVLRPKPASLAIRYMRFHHWFETAKWGAAGVEYILTCNALYAREALEAVDGFDPGFRTAGGEDADLGRRIVAAGYRLAYDPTPLAYHQSPTGVRALLATAYRYGQGEGYARRKSGRASIGPTLGTGLLRLGAAPIRAARYLLKERLPWRDAVAFAGLDSLVALAAALGMAARVPQPLQTRRPSLQEE